MEHNKSSIPQNKILILGSGGREHALAWKFAQDAGWDNVFTAPGNGGIPNSYALDIQNFEAVKDFCEKHQIEMIFVGPEQPLAEGIVDFFKSTDIQIIGPDKLAAQLEASKIFAKKFMQKYSVSTAAFQSFNHTSDAEKLIAEKNGNLVIKFDGLAGGKGVFVCSSVAEAQDALQKLEQSYGKDVPFIIEDKIPGNEVSVIAFTDGHSIKTLQPSQDHKQLNEGDTGPNTGGMGAFCPVDMASEIMVDINKNIIEPTLKGIQAEKMYYKGVIYFGIMVKDGKSYLLEYNVRFGDPETEVLLPALKTSLWDISRACLQGNLSETTLEFNPGYFVDVVLVSGGYPTAYEKGKPIRGLEDVNDDIIVFHAGTKSENGQILTNGGRVLNVVAHAETLEKARSKAYEAVEKIKFDKMYYRKDIGMRENYELKMEN